MSLSPEARAAYLAAIARRPHCGSPEPETPAAARPLFSPEAAATFRHNRRIRQAERLALMTDHSVAPPIPSPARKTLPPSRSQALAVVAAAARAEYVTAPPIDNTPEPLASAGSEARPRLTACRVWRAADRRALAAAALSVSGQ